MDFPGSGRVADIAFARLFGALAVENFTGSLRLEQKGRRFLVGWRDGAVVDGESDSPEDTLGRVALEAGLIGASELGEAVRRMAQSPAKRQLDVLVEMGALAGETAERAARLTLSRRVQRLFAMYDATYGVDDQPPPRSQGGPIEARWALYRGLRNHYDERRLERELGGLTGFAVKLGAEPTDGFAFGDDERVALAFLAKGYWDIEDLAHVCHSLPRITLLALVLSLWSCNVLDAKPAKTVARLRKKGVQRPAAPTPPPPPPPPPAERKLAPTPLPSSLAPPPPAERKLAPTPLPQKRPSYENVASDASIAVLRDQIRRKLAQVEGGADHFAILEIPKSAQNDQAKSAYFKLAKVYHPDRLTLSNLDDLRPHVERIFARLSEAFAVLGDDTRRRDYLQGGDQAARTGDQAARAHQIIAAEEHFRKGEMALRRQQFALAYDEFKASVELNPDEAEHHALLAWALFCQSGDKERGFVEARKHMVRAFEINDACLPAHLYFGQMYKQKGELERAAAHFSRVLDVDDRHVEANRELRLIGMRKKEKKPGILDLFKKK